MYTMDMHHGHTLSPYNMDIHNGCKLCTYIMAKLYIWTYIDEQKLLM